MRCRRASRFADRIRADRRGAVLVEFALLAPVLITLLIGVVQVGLHVQNSNAVRNLASDGARMAVVQYQRGNALTADQIQAMVVAQGVGPKYNLHPDRLAVEVTEPASRIGGVREMRIRISYNAPDYLAFVDNAGLGIDYERPVFLLIPA